MTNQTVLPLSIVPAPLLLPAPPPPHPHLALYKPPKKKKRTKLVRVDSPSSSTPAPRARKPDPSAPKITPPCTECGKRFWSWKALFGHMRCHPERQWRGINPPSSVVKRHDDSAVGFVDGGVTDEDREVAACLLLLANGPRLGEVVRHDEFDNHEEMINANGFECSSCKKVFGSHQALGGHRASHKNVKGCFAIHNGGGNGDVEEDREREREMVGMGLGGHKCGICMRVFSSGQALGGHKRCHFEKGGLNCFDLNLPAPVEDYYEFNDPTFSCISSGLALDLRLGI